MLKLPTDLKDLRSVFYPRSEWRPSASYTRRADELLEINRAGFIAVNEFENVVFNPDLLKSRIEELYSEMPPYWYSRRIIL